MTRQLLATLVLGISVVDQAYGHHSYADYDDRTVTIEGTLEEVAFGNPHTVLTIRTPDAGVYTATWRTARQLLRDGVTGEHLKSGDVVAVSGNPSRVRADVSKITEVRRLRDGWAWRVHEDGQITVPAAR